MVIRQRVAVWTLVLLGACKFESPSGPDAPPPPTVAFEFDKSGADEQIGTVNLPVVLSKPSETTVTVDFSVLGGGSATPAMDFAVTSTQVTFAPGITRVEIPVQILSDLDDSESDEVFTIALAEPRGATLDELKAIHEVRIADHLLPRLNFASGSLSTTTSEGTPTSLTIELTAPSEGISTFTLGVTPGATNPVDIEDLVVAADLVVNVPNGAMSVTVPLGQLDDTWDEEDDENVNFTLKGASQNLVLGQTISAAHIIQDNEATPTVSFDVAVNNTTEGATATVTVNLSNESQRAISVDYTRNANSTANANDATISGTTLSFAPHTVGVAGQQTQSFTVAITDDDVDEDAESVVLDLTNLVIALPGARLTHTLTIAASDPATVQFQEPTSTRDEDLNGNAIINIRLSNPSSKPVSVTWTITGGTATNGDGNDDYTSATSATVNFQPGDVDESISIDVHGNSPGSEGPETIIFTLSGPSNATLGTPGTHTHTITE